MNQRAEATAAQPRDARTFVAPEIAVMHQHGIKIVRHGVIEQRLAGADPREQAGNLGSAFHLQAVWAIILKAGGVQIGVQMVDEFGKCDAGGVSGHDGLRAGK